VQRGRHEIDTVGMPADEAIEQAEQAEAIEDTAFFPVATPDEETAQPADQEDVNAESTVDSLFTEQPVDEEATGRTATGPDTTGTAQPTEGDPRDLPVRKRRPAAGGTGANGSAASTTSAASAAAHVTVANGSSASAEPGSSNGAAQTNGAHNSALVDTAIWPTVADDGWEAADDALDPTPASYTDAGLPRRKPRAQLVPGSVATKGKPAMAGVDAGTVRDRLNSFQRGVRQGRDGSATAAADGIEHGFQWENE
jgi:hypothetical protein